MPDASVNVRDRFEEHARAWHVAVESILDTETSLIGFGQRNSQAVVLKVVKQCGEEWASGDTLRAFQGHGVVDVYECAAGAVLIERLSPGRSLVGTTLEGKDDEAVDIIADVIHQMSAPAARPGCVTVRDWGKAFERRHPGIPPDLAEEGHRWFTALASSQRNVRLLHGDLHHYNILFDSHRGWLAIDPKGVVGETEYELGAVLRNPVERPDMFILADTVERRLARFERRLNVDFQRALAWGFAQAVLSAIWSVEDGLPVNADSSSIRLANTIRVMLPPIP